MRKLGPLLLLLSIAACQCEGTALLPDGGEPVDLLPDGAVALPDGGSGPVGCERFEYLASGAACASCSFRCDCGDQGFPKSISACTPHGCIVGGNCEQICAAELSEAVTCATDAYNIRAPDGGTNPTCPSGQHGCNGVCVPDDDVSACGTSCTVCPSANGVATCASGTCQLSCNSGFHKCSGACFSNDSVETCGGRCSPCAQPANATATQCVAGQCVINCNPGFHLCGSECMPDVSPTSCGTSCLVCAEPPPLQRATCAGTCGASTCINSCNSSCVDVASDEAHCGACNAPCAVNDRCVLGKCQKGCALAWGLGGGSPILHLGAPITEVAVGDVNLDGVKDVVTSSGTVDQLSVLLGSTTGALRDGGVSSGGMNPVALALADFNADGREDVAVTQRDGGAVAVALAQASGALGAPASTPLGARPEAVAVADFNGDGNQDVAVALASTQLALLLGNGNGTLQTPLLSALPGTFACFAKGDLNSDGRMDLAVAGGGKVRLFLGQPSGSWTTPADATTNSATDCFVGQFDADSTPDVVTVGAGNLNVWKGDGAGGLTTGPKTPVPNGCWRFQAADLNADGKTDIAAVCTSTFDLRAYYAAGDGTFTQAWVAPGPWPSGRLVLADVTNDGHTDVVVAGDQEVSVMRGLGGGAFDMPRWTAGVSTGVMATGDFDQNGFLDLALAGTTTDVSLYLGSAGGFAAPVGVGDGGFFTIAAGDYDGDGRSDLAVSSFYKGVRLYRYGAGGLQPVATYPPADAGSDILVSRSVDLNNDARADLLFVGGNELVRRGGTVGGLGELERLATYTFDVQDVDFADFNLDGQRDLAVGLLFNDVHVLLGVANGTFVLGPQLNGEGATRMHPGAGDLNGDGKPDLIVSDGFIAGQGNGAFVARAASMPLPNTSRAVLADVTGDGVLDVLTQSGPFDRELQIHPGLGNGQFGARISLRTMGSPGSIAVADVNQDGRPDVVLGTPTGVQTYLGSCQ